MRFYPPTRTRPLACPILNRLAPSARCRSRASSAPRSDADCSPLQRLQRTPGATDRDRAARALCSSARAPSSRCSWRSPHRSPWRRARTPTSSGTRTRSWWSRGLGDPTPINASTRRCRQRRRCLLRLLDRPTACMSYPGRGACRPRNESLRPRSVPGHHHHHHHRRRAPRRLRPLGGCPRQRTTMLPTVKRSIRTVRCQRRACLFFTTLTRMLRHHFLCNRAARRDSGPSHGQPSLLPRTHVLRKTDTHARHRSIGAVRKSVPDPRSCRPLHEIRRLRGAGEARRPKLRPNAPWYFRHVRRIRRVLVGRHRCKGLGGRR